eukprot:CAMPEP_0197487804 /NCGR_PEP_ID=MMETSP1311-20131121/2834_1 /TAXON_ID=464262 /ORGANISM="Genus nov. species nov., Strain RCC856" /LENGTH=86 /DNA_ID=CAMNT_0043031623 /DNA_START=15 /DNA_END=271 /DNA_ORIENTATION=+
MMPAPAAAPFVPTAAADGDGNLPVADFSDPPAAAPVGWGMSYEPMAYNSSMPVPQQSGGGAANGSEDAKGEPLQNPQPPGQGQEAA